MNTITMQSKLFHSYFDDRQFLKNAEMQARDYLKKYRETGICAFYDFVVVTDDNSSAPMYLHANHDISDNTYGIVGITPFYKRSQNDSLRYSELLYSYEYIEEDVIDLCIDLPKENDGINDDIIQDFGNDILKFPPELIDKISAKSLPLVCIFAKVQMSALKTSKKIQKATKRAQSMPMQFQPTATPPKPNVIYLDEKMTLTIDANDEPDSKRKFIRHCEAWMVRGHYRHYKSGKVVYISPYKKGNGRVNDKTYKTTKNGVTGKYQFPRTPRNI